MKKLLFLLMMPVLSFGQTETNVNVQNNTSVKSGGTRMSQLVDQYNEDRKRLGTHYLGKGVYRIVNVGKSSAVSNKKVKQKAFEMLDDLINKNNFKYKILDELLRERVFNASVAIYTITVQTLNQDGSIVMNDEDVDLQKNEAKKKLLELKQLKEEGIITQEEYDKAAAPHKKILLGL
tara:strand:+ start:581 stop:1114 length:534 start_codon:yes stop_codon:yes gene_type:complete